MSIIKKNTFAFNVATLMTGTVVAQSITFIVTPILTRIFTPSEFGSYALYLAIVGIVSIVSSWKYELAIVLPEEEKDAQALLFLSIVITIFMSLLTLLILTISKLLVFKNLGAISSFIWLLPIGVLINGFLLIFNSWGTRKEFFKMISCTGIIQSSSIAVSQLLLKIYNICPNSLAWGNIIGTFSALLTLIQYSIRKSENKFRELSRDIILSNSKRYDKFPKYQSFSVFLNSFSQHLPIILMTLFYSPEIAGYFALTHRALYTPARLLGGSVRRVYYQRASKIFNTDRKGIWEIYLKTTMNLAKISIIPYLIIAIFARKIFTSVFGEEWLVSGLYAQLIMCYIFTLTINPPATMSLQILGLQKFSLKYEFFLALFRFLSIYSGYILFNSHYASVGFYSIVGFLFNFYLMHYVYRKIKKHI